MPKSPGKDKGRLVASFVQSRSLDLASDYAGRGRRLAAHSTAELSDAWIGALRKLVPDPSNLELNREWNDISAEFQLREQDPPFDQAQKEVEAWISAVDALIVDKKQHDPDDWKRMNRDLSSDLDEFERQKARGS